MTAIPFVRPDLPEPGDVLPALADVMASGVLTKGPRLEAFEAAVCQATGAAQAVGVSSCTVGLALVMRCLRHMRPGTQTEVILPSFMFLAGPAAVVWAGLTPVFVDADPDSWTVDPDAVEAAVSPRTFAIVGCHTFGSPCAVAKLVRIAGQAGVPLLFDAAHAFGSSIGGRQVGREGMAQAFSLSPTKLVVAGEGGMVTTNDAELARLVREAREYGNDGRYGCTVPGLNGRMPEMCAAVGLASLGRLPRVAAHRAAAAAAYAEGLRRLPGVALQKIPEGAASSWKDFSITIDPERFGATRDTVRARLAAASIDTRAYYSPACHAMEAFRGFHVGRPPLPVTDRLAATSLSLPMGRHVGPEEARSIAGFIAEIAGS